MISLDNFIVYDLVRQALKEDIGHGDLTTNSGTALNNFLKS